MSPAIPLVRDAPKGIGIEWWQPGEAERLNCTGFSCVVTRTTLPFVPAIVTVDAPQGLFRIEPPSPAQAEDLIVGKTYPLRIVLRNALGEGVEAIDLTLQVL